MRLLIADDELVLRRGLLSLDWDSIGISEVFSASNGIEAKELLLSTAIDIVIFDIRMPGLTGLELAAMVKEYSLDTAVILLTGFSEFEYAREAMKNQVYEYLLKPFRPRDILAAVEDVKNRLERDRYQRKVIREYEDKAGMSDTVSQVKNRFPKASGMVCEILMDMAREYDSPLTLSELSKRRHFSVNYISKKIKQETGYSFIDLLSAMRLTNAARFLTEGEKVNQAAIKAGFNDQRYFSQVFRKAFATSPSEFKRQEHENTELSFHSVLERLGHERGSGL